MVGLFQNFDDLLVVLSLRSVKFCKCAVSIPTGVYKCVILALVLPYLV